jgi:hypothetical protein
MIHSGVSIPLADAGVKRKDRAGFGRNSGAFEGFALGAGARVPPLLGDGAARQRRTATATTETVAVRRPQVQAVFPDAFATPATDRADDAIRPT